MKSINQIIAEEVKKFLAEQTYRAGLTSRGIRSSKPMFPEPDPTPTEPAKDVINLRSDPESAPIQTKRPRREPEPTKPTSKPDKAKTLGDTLKTGEKEEVDLAPAMDQMRQRSREVLGLPPGKVSPVEKEVDAEKPATTKAVPPAQTTPQPTPSITPKGEDIQSDSGETSLPNIEGAPAGWVTLPDGRSRNVGVDPKTGKNYTTNQADAKLVQKRRVLNQAAEKAGLSRENYANLLRSTPKGEQPSPRAIHRAKWEQWEKKKRSQGTRPVESGSTYEETSEETEGDTTIKDEFTRHPDGTVSKIYSKTRRSVRESVHRIIKEEVESALLSSIK